MLPRPPGSTRTYPLFPYKTLFRSLRQGVGVRVVDIQHFAGWGEASAGEGRDIVRRWCCADDIRVAAALRTQQVIQDQCVAFAKDADQARLANPPPVHGKSDVSPASRKLGFEDRAERKSRSPLGIEVQINGTAGRRDLPARTVRHTDRKSTRLKPSH